MSSSFHTCRCMKPLKAGVSLRIGTHMNITTQIERGILVCPQTRQQLRMSDDRQWLATTDNAKRYRLLHGKIPVLLADPKWAGEYASSSTRMNEAYSTDGIARRNSLFHRLRRRLTSDYRTESSKQALIGLFHGLPGDALCISVGGGPSRADPRLVNLNIAPFPNVDVVADAHQLPYADKSVDAIHSEAVFEHLHDPVKAAGEIYRVLKPGKRAYICTPFLQAYHGYPHHYQNFTISGHKHLFELAGLQIVEAGSCVGPVYTLVNLTSVFINEYFPAGLRMPLRLLWDAFGIVIRPLDKVIGKKANAYIMASTTYVIVQKP